MKKIIVFGYGLICYLIFFTTFLYLIAFIGNIIVPKSLDSSLQGNFIQALIIDLGLILLFGIQHSGMARPSFKQWWTKTIPTVIERSTYVLFTSLMLLILFWQWQPLGGIIWQIKNPIFTYIMYGFSALGWLLVLASTFLINHFDLFGLRQVSCYLKGQEYQHLEFKTVGIYKYVRHPLMLGFLITFWSTPSMTITHLIFALGMTIYILIAIKLEERDLIDIYGSLYEEYRQQVPMLIPMGKYGIKPKTNTSQ